MLSQIPNELNFAFSRLVSRINTYGRNMIIQKHNIILVKYFFACLFFLPDTCMPLDRRFGKDGKNVTLSLFRLVNFFPCYLITLEQQFSNFCLCRLYLSIFTVLNMKTEKKSKYLFLNKSS